jgi:hypothetical protein
VPERSGRMKPELRSVVAAFAAVRADPDDAAAQVAHVLAGEPLHVEEWRDAWARVRTVYDYRGWVRAGALRGGDPVEQARSYLGAPYLRGGLTERGIDCSGLVRTSGLSARSVPRDAEQQEQAGTAVNEPRPGDLVTYGDKVAPDQSRSGSVATASSMRRAVTASRRSPRRSQPTIGPAAGSFACDASSLVVGHQLTRPAARRSLTKLVGLGALACRARSARAR